MSPFEHGEVFVLDDGGEVCASPHPPTPSVVSSLYGCRAGQQHVFTPESYSTQPLAGSLLCGFRAPGRRLTKLVSRGFTHHPVHGCSVVQVRLVHVGV
jgi:hypothetical protein